MTKKDLVDTLEYTLLLVEDDLNDIMLIKRALNGANINNHLQVVDNGEDAIRYLEGSGEYENRDKYPIPILVLLDLKLPRKSGHEVLEWIRSKPKLKRLPVVVLTSSQSSIDINRAYDLGANSYLIKPILFENLLNIMKNFNMYWFILNEKPKIDSGVER